MILNRLFGLQARISMDGKKSEDLDDLYFGSYIMSDAVGSDYFHAIKYETILQVFERLFGHMGMHPLLCCPPCF